MSEEEHINEGDFEEAIKRKVVVRGGKKIRKKVTTKSGYRMAGGKQVRMSASEKRKRAKGAKKAARKRRGRMAGILRKRKRSLRKRKSLNMGESWSQNWVQSISQAAFGVMTEGSQKYYDPTYFGSHDQSLIVFVGSKEFEEVEFKTTFIKTLRKIVGRLNGRPQEDYKAGIMAFEFDVSDLNAGEVTKVIEKIAKTYSVSLNNDGTVSGAGEGDLLRGIVYTRNAMSEEAYELEDDEELVNEFWDSDDFFDPDDNDDEYRDMEDDVSDNYYGLEEEIDPNEFPDPLPRALAQIFKGKGKRDGDAKDDVIRTRETQWPAAKLLPSQDAIYLGKSLGMAIGGVKGGNLGSIVSNDNRILDGHHRWAATCFNDPKARVGGVEVDLPIKDLIPVLRAMGDAYGNARRGNPGGGDLNIYQAKLKDALDAIYHGKYMNPKFYDKDAAVEWLESIGGEKVLAERLMSIQSKTPPAGAPPRNRMPVIDADKGEHLDAAKALAKGELDVYPPYAKESFQSLESKIKQVTLDEMVRYDNGNLQLDNLGDPDNPNVVISGYGVMSVNRLRKEISGRLQELSKMTDRNTDKLYFEVLNDRGILRLFVSALQDVEKQLASATVKRRITMLKKGSK